MAYRQPGSDPWDPRMNPNNPDLSGRFGGLNIGAPAFVPNVNAVSFTPRFNTPQQYGQFGQNTHMYHPGLAGPYGMQGQYPIMQQQQQQQYHTPYQQPHPAQFQPYQPMKQQPSGPQQQNPIPVSVLEGQMESSNYPTTTAERTTPLQPQGEEVEPVESWEDLADSSTQSHPPPTEGGEEGNTEGTTAVTPAELIEHPETKEVTSKGTDDAIGMDDETEGDVTVAAIKEPIDQSSLEKKPSPPTDRISKAAAKAAPPVKSKDDKENLNIVFIGHVGKVISARKGEFETGFEKRGQTREHAMLAKTVGVKHLVILVNKMDDPTVGWSEERFEECKTKLVPFLKKVGFNPKTDIFFIPVSGLLGTNLKDQGPDMCPWYSGPAFIPYLDSLPAMSREETGPFRMPIVDKYKDMGTIVLGKLESGAVGKGTQLLVMPNKVQVEVLSVMRGEDETSAAFAGDNIKLKLKGIEEEDISSGFVLCDPLTPCHVGTLFQAQIMIMEVKSIICAGYSAVLHIHSAVEEVHIKQLLSIIDKKTGKPGTQKPRFVKQDQVAIAELQTDGPICLETFKEFPPMARFTLRDEGKTIAIGKILKLIE